MELFDCQEYAAARQRDTMRAFRQAERGGLTRERPVGTRSRWFGIFRQVQGETAQTAGTRVELRPES